MVEFMLCSLIWLPLLLGTIVFGINIIQAIRVSQLSRDTGHMLALQVDFTTAQNQALLGQLGSSLNIKSGSGNGAVVLSQITLVSDADCAAGGYTNSCANRGKYVFKNMVIFGNVTYAKTTMGSPPLSTIAAGHVIQPADYLNNSSYQANNFSNVLTFTANVSGQYAYVSEVFVNTQSVQWSAFNNTGSTARSIF